MSEPFSYGTSDSEQNNDNEQKKFRIGELNPGLVGTDHFSMIESDKS
jgi:hypothetical protein